MTTQSEDSAKGGRAQGGELADKLNAYMPDFMRKQFMREIHPEGMHTNDGKCRVCQVNLLRLIEGFDKAIAALREVESQKAARVETCKRCSGHGFEDGECTQECDECNGTGFVSSTPPPSAASSVLALELDEDELRKVYREGCQMPGGEDHGMGLLTLQRHILAKLPTSGRELRFTDSGSILHEMREYARQEKEGREAVCYTPCEKHKGMSWTARIGWTPPVRAVCPICEPPESAGSGTKGQA